jgi:DNA primase
MAVDHLKYKNLYGLKRNLVLYGLHHRATQEMIVKTKSIILEEGYTDVWRSHMHGAPHTTALGGTELTSNQLGLLRSFDLQYAILYFDPDGPGWLAAQKVAKQLMRYMTVLVAIPPKDLDPGDILESQAFWAPIAQAKPFTPKE